MDLGIDLWNQSLIKHSRQTKFIQFFVPFVWHKQSALDEKDLYRNKMHTASKLTSLPQPSLYHSRDTLQPRRTFNMHNRIQKHFSIDCIH